MNPQQQTLRELLMIAVGDLDVGRPAQGVSSALQAALRATPFDDLERGLVDDQQWRAARGLRT